MQYGVQPIAHLASMNEEAENSTHKMARNTMVSLHLHLTASSLTHFSKDNFILKQDLTGNFTNSESVFCLNSNVGYIQDIMTS